MMAIILWMLINQSLEKSSVWPSIYAIIHFPISCLSLFAMIQAKEDEKMNLWQEEHQGDPQDPWLWFYTKLLSFTKYSCR